MPLSTTSAAPIHPFPRVDGTVKAVISDGSGGWYIGGTFISVGGLGRSNLAHILAGGSVSAWNPGTNGAVLALALDGGTLYAGGDFSNVGGQTRNRLAAINATTGAISSWNPNPNSTVNSIVVTGD